MRRRPLRAGRAGRPGPDRLAQGAVLAGLVASGLALALSPALLPENYTWVSNTTSEGAAQRVEGAWLARLGFLLFGLFLSTGLIDAQPLTLRAAHAAMPNGMFVHDRRSGERVEVASVDSAPLARHAADELYGTHRGQPRCRRHADHRLLARRPRRSRAVPRLSGDLRANGKLVIADLTGRPLRAALRGGVALLRLSDEELAAEQYAASNAPSDLVAAARGCRPRAPRTCSSPAPPSPRCSSVTASPGRAAARRSPLRAAGSPGHGRLHVRRHRRRPRPRRSHDRRTAPRHGRRVAERHAPRSGNGHPARDRAAGRARHGPPGRRVGGTRHHRKDFGYPRADP